MISEFGWTFVDVAEVALLHRAAIDEYGGASSEPRAGCVESSIGNAVNAAMYEDEGGQADLLLAVAYLLVYLAKNHCFMDGNKRVAWMSAIRALDANGIRVVADQQEAAKLVEDVATGSAGVRDVLLWLTAPGRLVAASGWS